MKNKNNETGANDGAQWHDDIDLYFEFTANLA